MIRAVIFLSLIFLSSGSFAQRPGYDKFSASLKLFLHNGSSDKHFLLKTSAVKMIPVFIELAPGASEETISKKGVKVRTIAGNIMTADISLSQLDSIALLSDVKRIELPLLFRRTDTLMKKYVTVDRIQNKEAPLDSAYSGKNTLIGIIDDGIDITHPEFLDSSKKTRIKSIWNMDYQHTPPLGYAYGHEWTSDSIDVYRERYENSQFTGYQMENFFGYCNHGTSVSGLAAGNSGIAPGADIVSVALTAFSDTILSSDRIIDGISYIYSKAKEAKKKCVINISLGLMDGAPHDGKSMVERAIDNFCAERPDLLICVSAGNNGNNWKHWGGFPINSDSSFCFFRVAYKGSLYFAIPRQHGNTLSISVTDSKLGAINAPNISRDLIIYQTPYWRISDIIQQATPIVMRSFLPNGFPSATIHFTASHYNDDYDELIVTFEEHSSTNTQSVEHLGRFIFKGSGEVHGWYPFLNLHPQYVFDQNPYPNDPTYHVSDNNYTTNIPSHAFSVLSSGAYNIRNCYVNIHDKIVNAYTPCQLTYFTSRGPTQDGRIKPDIIAPGENVIAPRSRFQDYLGHEFILSTDLVAFSGTSASSPITAGIAALVWERFPEYTRDSVIKRIKSTAYTDAFTDTFGPVPNNRAGWGKVDAFKALTGLSTDVQPVCEQILVCQTDVPANPSEPPPVSTENDVFFILSPNPASSFFSIMYSSVQPFRLSMYDGVGQLMMTKDVSAGNSMRYWLNVAHLATGIYYIRASINDRQVVKKILLIR